MKLLAQCSKFEIAQIATKANLEFYVNFEIIIILNIIILRVSLTKILGAHHSNKMRQYC